MKLMRQISTVIEIGTGKIVSIIGEVGQYDETHIIGSASKNYAGYKNGKWAERNSLPETVLAVLREAEKKAGRRIKYVHVGIPADFVKAVCKQVDVTFKTRRTVTQSDVDELYLKGSKFQLAKPCTVLHRCPVRFTLDDARRTMEPVGRQATKLSAIVSYVVAEKWFINGITKMLSENGYTASTFVAASYAESMRFIPQEKRDRSAVMLDIGEYSACVMIARGDGLIYHKVFPFGGGNITGDLEKVFNVKHSMAEELKRRAIFGLSLGEDDFYEVCDSDSYKLIRFSALKVQEIIEARLCEMIRIITDSLDNSGCNLPKYVPLYVTGGTASMRGIREFIQKFTEHNTVIVQPQSTCFNNPAYSSSLAVMDMALDAEVDDEPGFWESIKNLFYR